MDTKKYTKNYGIEPPSTVRSCPIRAQYVRILSSSKI